MEKKQIILDCDNTMGVEGCDIDDGLALLYLLGNDTLADVKAVCTTYGNSTLETVHTNTCEMFKRWDLDIPLYKGAKSAEQPISDAAYYLCEAVNKQPGKLSLLLTGSLTNLHGAVLLDADFFSKVKEISLMGGVTQTLELGGTQIKELNLSCDPLASCMVLAAPCPVMVATAQNCLPAFFTLESFKANIYDPQDKNGGSIYESCLPWFETQERNYSITGFVCWDVVAAAYLLQPYLFDEQQLSILASENNLSQGLLKKFPINRDSKQTEGINSNLVTVNAACIKDSKIFVQDVYASWKRAILNISSSTSLTTLACPHKITARASQ
jgi:purine nucleosidase